MVQTREASHTLPAPKLPWVTQGRSSNLVVEGTRVDEAKCGRGPEKLEARRAVVLAAMVERAGQRRKSKITDDFDAFLLVRSGGRRGWATATDDDVFDWACFIDSQGHGTRGCTIGVVPAWA